MKFDKLYNIMCTGAKFPLGKKSAACSMLFLANPKIKHFKHILWVVLDTDGIYRYMLKPYIPTMTVDVKYLIMAIVT